MKKIIFLIIAIISLSFVTAQAQALLSADKYFWEYKGNATDTVGATVTVWQSAVQLNKVDGLYYNAKVKVADVVAGAGARVIMEGKIFADDAWTPIDSITWYGGNTDTTVVFTHNTNKTYHRYLNFKVRRTAQKAKVSYIGLSLKK